MPQNPNPTSCFLDLPQNKQRRLYLQPGLSIGGIDTGTLGLLLQDTTGQPYLLTCYHVLCYNQYKRPITQPATGPDMGQFGQDTVAYSYLYQHPHTGLDAALGIVDPRLRSVRPAQAGTSDIIRNFAQPKVGQQVKKSGRSTGITCGTIEKFDNFPVTYRWGLGTYNIWGFRVIPNDPTKPIARKGDSGAVFYDPTTLLAVGLIVSSNDTPPYDAIACPLSNIIRNFNLPLSPLQHSI